MVWKKNGEEASGKGTAVHANIGSFYNGMPHETDSKEFELFSKFREDYPELKPYRSEWVMFDDDSKICGSIDMIYTDEEGRYIMCDFKRSKEIKYSNRWEKGCSPITSKLDN